MQSNQGMWLVRLEKLICEPDLIMVAHNNSALCFVSIGREIIDFVMMGSVIDFALLNQDLILIKSIP